MTTPHTPPSPLEIADMIEMRAQASADVGDRSSAATFMSYARTIRDQHARLAACEKLLAAWEYLPASPFMAIHQEYCAQLCAALKTKEG